jgi:hypothetical protein
VIQREGIAIVFPRESIHIQPLKKPGKVRRIVGEDPEGQSMEQLSVINEREARNAGAKQAASNDATEGERKRVSEV